MDVEAHMILAALHKAQLEKQAELAMKEDICVHEEHMKNALKKKEEIITEKHESLTHEDYIERGWHTNMKECEERAKEIGINRDMQHHEERMERAARHQQELAAKKFADAQRFDRSIEEHRKKAALRHAAATIPESGDNKPSTTAITS